MGNRVTVSDVDSVDPVDPVDFVDFVDFLDFLDPDPDFDFDFDFDNDRSPLIGKSCLAKEAYKTVPAPHGRGVFFGSPATPTTPPVRPVPKARIGQLTPL